MPDEYTIVDGGRSNLQTTLTVGEVVYKIEYEGDLVVFLNGPDVYKMTANYNSQRDLIINDLLFRSNYGSGITTEDLILQGFILQS